MNISGGDKFEAKLAEIAAKLARGGKLRAGFFEDATYPGGTSVAMVAALNNFGSGRTPPRPFFTNAIREHSGEWANTLATLMEKTGNDVEQSLATLGEIIVGNIKDSIAQTNSPPNAPVTNLLKQRFPLGKQSGMTPGDVWQAFADVAAGESAPAGKPLDWTGTMLNSVSYEVSS